MIHKSKIKVFRLNPLLAPVKPKTVTTKAAGKLFFSLLWLLFLFKCGIEWQHQVAHSLVNWEEELVACINVKITNKRHCSVEELANWVHIYWPFFGNSIQIHWDDCMRSFDFGRICVGFGGFLYVSHFDNMGFEFGYEVLYMFMWII